MKKILSILLCVAMIAAACIAFSACGKQNDGKTDDTGAGSEIEQPDEIAGGMNKADSPEITDEFKKVFEKATAELVGVEYTPVAYLASQVVAGTNHCVLCKATPVVPDARTTYSVVYIYEDLSGNAEITDIVESEAAADYPELDGGWFEAESPVLTDDAKQALEKACEMLTGAEYTPVALLATQVVAGTNYRIVCEATATVPGAESEYVIVDVAADLEGGAELIETYEFGTEGNM